MTKEALRIDTSKTIWMIVFQTFAQYEQGDLDSRATQPEDEEVKATIPVASTLRRFAAERSSNSPDSRHAVRPVVLGLSDKQNPFLFQAIV